MSNIQSETERPSREERVNGLIHKTPLYLYKILGLAAAIVSASEVNEIIQPSEPLVSILVLLLMVVVVLKPKNVECPNKLRQYINLGLVSVSALVVMFPADVLYKEIASLSEIAPLDPSTDWTRYIVWLVAYCIAVITEVELEPRLRKFARE